MAMKKSREGIDEEQIRAAEQNDDDDYLFCLSSYTSA